MKHLEPTMGVGLQRLFTRAGRIVDEFRTSRLLPLRGVSARSSGSWRTRAPGWKRRDYGRATRATQVRTLQAAVEQRPKAGRSTSCEERRTKAFTLGQTIQCG
ncbi:hypothetical protein BASA81_006757 [Batrachochytrium salamandrivorans]|nr:hypothetical protein BASA81_006757 [Batrachochytrium salamandrivorans]